MKPHDAIAITAGTIAGTNTGNELDSILASAAAAVAVYLVKLGLNWLRKRIE